MFSNYNGLNLEIKNGSKFGKFTNMWKWNTFINNLNDKWVKGEIEKVNEKCFETQENDNTRYQNLCSAAKAVLRGKFVAINKCLH